MLHARGLRLPGVYFLPPPRVGGPRLPPLDVAAFVGFASRGPLDTPVAIEDLRTYQAIFGGDLPLARDQAGRTIYANLPTAVASFFANGGRRCYVVRVAGKQARATRFAPPGLVAFDDSGNARPAAISAAWPGRWSADLYLGTRLRSTPLPADKFRVTAARQLAWETDSAPQAIRPGDLLRLRFDDDRTQWIFPVSSVTRPTDAELWAMLDARRTWRMIDTIPASPPPQLLSAARLRDAGPETLTLGGQLGMDEQGIVLTFYGPSAGDLRRGDTLDLRLTDGAALLLSIGELRPAATTTSPPAPGVARASMALLRDEQPLPLGSPVTRPRQVERLRFDLLLRQGNQWLPAIGDLAFNAGHPRFWGVVALAESSTLQPAAQTDSKRAPKPARPQPRGTVFQESDSDIESTPAAQAAEIYQALLRSERSVPARDGAREGAALAATLAALEEPAATLTYLPLEMPTLPGDDDLASPIETGDDDLRRFEARPFLDEYLIPFPNNQATPADALMAEALDRYYIQDQRLNGLHSLLFVDEVALITVPDAVHRPWERVNAAVAPLQPVAPATLSPPDPCPPAGSPFASCDLPPALTSISPPAGPLDGGTAVAITGSGFALGGALTVTFGRKTAQATELIDDGQIRCVTPAGGTIGPVAVTVRNANGAATLPDAFTYQPHSTAPELPGLSELDYALEQSPLLPIQQALIAACQARRDALGVLSLPAHFEKRHCIEWQQQLRLRLGLPARRIVYDNGGLGADLSYAAVYHPWLLQADARSPDRVRPVPCDGAICGMIAARERLRQVWVAPANVPLVDVLGLTPQLVDDDWAELFDLQFNLVRPEPEDFRAMSAHTLGDVRALLQISVRRLMILLRKAALERGAEFVFESNHEQFRAGVRAVLNNLLRFMFERGAFAGETPEVSYRVVTDSSVNPPQSIDQGRFVAEIQVRPSQPIEFLTVLLTRTDEGQVLVREV